MSEVLCSAIIDQHIARYDYANSHPRTPCTDGRWHAGAYMQCEGPRLYEARWHRLIGTGGSAEGGYVPDRALLCEPHARAFSLRWGLYMPGEEPKEAVAAIVPQNGPPQSPQRHATDVGSSRTPSTDGPGAVAVCGPCYPAWGSYAAARVHVPSPGGCPHRCHQAVPA